MDKGKHKDSKKGVREGSTFSFNPHYVFNTVWHVKTLEEFDPYNPQLDLFKKGEEVAFKNIDGHYYKGIMIRDYKDQRIAIEIKYHTQRS